MLLINALSRSAPELLKYFILTIIIGIIDIKKIAGAEFVGCLAGITVQLVVVEFFDIFKSHMLILEYVFRRNISVSELVFLNSIFNRVIIFRGSLLFDRPSCTYGFLVIK